LGEHGTESLKKKKFKVAYRAAAQNSGNHHCDLASLEEWPTIAHTVILPRIIAMAQRIETNLFFEQGLYMTLFASNAGGL
jgi:hypothetical protein